MGQFVLHISTADNSGGSGRSAYKIHCGLRELGIESRMLVRDRTTSDCDVQRISNGWLRLADKAAAAVTNAVGLQYLLVPSSHALFRHPWFQSADVVQLYNTHGDYLSHTILPRLCRTKRVVWRLSDMWPFTGHCAYAGSCERWQEGCGRCPDLAGYPALAWDTSSLLWRVKQRLYARSRFHVVAPSRWIASLVARSPLLRGQACTLIRNGVDTRIFKPLPRALCREALGLPQRGKAVLFLSHVARDNARKGSGHFLRAMSALAERRPDDLLAMVVGEGARDWAADVRCPLWRHDLVREDELLALIYNAADVLVHPAVAENLPNSVLEAMACGLPVVAFDTGGIAEVVEQQRTGWLAAPSDVGGLVHGLQVLLADDERRQALGDAARRKILTEYTIGAQARAFQLLYEQCVHQRTAA